MGNIKNRIKKMEKKIIDQKVVRETCIPIIEMSPEQKSKWKKGLPPPIMGGLSSNIEIDNKNL